MRDFARADQIYETRSNAEGRAEVLLRRGAYLDGIGMLEPARVDLERARTFAEGSRSEQFRAQLLLSSVTAAHGNLTLAETMAVDAIATAEREDLDATAADGLVQLAIVLQSNRKFNDADARLESALELAAKRGPLRVAARATVQRASVRIDQERFAEGVKMAEDALPSLRVYRYRRFELKALNVVARGRERLGQFAETRAAALEVLSRATDFKDDAQVGDALENLAGQANEIGNLPEAHDHRLTGVSIHRTQKEFGTLAYDLTNRADLLIRLGRSEEAGKLLDEVEEGIKKGIDAY